MTPMSIWVNIMNARRKKMTDNYLYEIIDDFKHSHLIEEKNNIFNSLCSSIWASDNKRQVYSKTIAFKVKKDLLETDVGQVFDAWSKVEYKGYKSISKETDWCSLIRQKINNLYTRYFDEEVILNRDYIRLLHMPKQLYYQWVAGTEMNSNNLATMIEESMHNAAKLKITYQKQKMNLSWKGYKAVIEDILHKILNNCKLIEDYEEKQAINLYDFMNEDNFYIGYFCKYLENEMKQWQKNYYGVRNHRNYKRCKLCGSLIENTGNKRMYCNRCAKAEESKNATIRKRKQRQSRLSRNRNC